LLSLVEVCAIESHTDLANEVGELFADEVTGLIVVKSHFGLLLRIGQNGLAAVDFLATSQQVIQFHGATLIGVDKP
jgi:hypothetical protein